MRERIISEIRRLADAAGGNPPGRQSFEADTGIRQHDWYGIYWARWGDALIEAGFAPNTLQRKTDRGFLLTQIAEACRYFGRMPSTGDFRLYRRSHSEFPSHGVLDKSFAGKSDLIESLRTWLVEHPEFADVASLLPEAREATTKRTAAKEMLGSVYLLQSGTNFKIGRSDEIERRIKEIRIALPDATTLVHAITTDDPAGIEAYWHRRFADKRANGEWFKLAPGDVLAFKRRKFQ